jgi:hypothetical protein
MNAQTAATVNATFHATQPHLELRKVTPAGDYTLEIVESDYLANETGTGMVLRFLMQVLDGARTGTHFVVDMTLENRDACIQAAGQREFKALRQALGVTLPGDTAELHHRAFRASVGKRQASAAHRTENYFSAFHVQPPGRDEKGRFRAA